MGDFLHKYLGRLILGTIILLIVISGAIICSCDLCLWGKYGSAIAGIASLVSIYILYVTLTQQGDSFKQERFEITFFNLMDHRKNAIDSLSFKCDVLSGLDFVSKKYQGEKCFASICQEVEYIKESLCSAKYIGMISDLDVSSALQGLATLPCVDEMIKEEQRRCRCKRANFTYKISKEVFETAKSLETENDVYRKCFQLILERKTLSVEYYLKCQRLILRLLVENEKIMWDDRYLQIFISQMSVSELKCLYYYSLVDSDLRRLMVSAKIKEQLECCLNDV